MSKELIIFENPDQEFLVFQSPSSSGEYYLQDGVEVFYEADSMSKDDIKVWAEEREYLNEEYDYIDENGQIDFASLRELIRQEEEENLPTIASPIGRALVWFQNLNFEIPKELDIELIDGYSPGNDWQEVNAKNYAALANLQLFLLDRDIKVNFIPKDLE